MPSAFQHVAETLSCRFLHWATRSAAVDGSMTSAMGNEKDIEKIAASVMENVRYIVIVVEEKL